MKFIVPYGVRLEADGHIETVPVVHARIKSIKTKKEVPGIFIVDSGATTTLLPATDAEVLGFEPALGQRVTIRGVTGHELLGYRHTVSIIIEDYRFHSVPVIFAEGSGIPRVLGREGIFSKFGIFFYEREQRIAFLDNQTERKNIEVIFS